MRYIILIPGIFLTIGIFLMLYDSKIRKSIRKFIEEGKLTGFIKAPGFSEPGQRIKALNDLPSLDDLIIKALQDNDVIVRKKAVEALGQIRNRNTIKSLVNVLADKDSDVRSLAAEALDNMGWKPGNTQEHISYGIAKGNRNSLISSGALAVEPLLRMLADERAENLNARVNAAIVLGRIGEVRAVEPLMKMLEDGQANIREIAAAALGEIGDTRTVEPLIASLKDKNANVRMAAVTALGKIGDTRSLEALIQVVGGKNPAVFGDRNPEVQKKAVEALGKIDDPRATTALIYALGDDDAIVRLQAAEMLDEIGWTPEKETETITYQIARGDWEALIPFRGQAVTPLSKLANDKDRNIREHVADTLAKILAGIKITVFGNLHVKDARKDITVCNPNVNELTVPMQELEYIVLHTATYDFHQVERFMTYAVNYIGQEYLKKHVLVHIYGDPDKLHSNLRNSFENLCKRVVVHKESKLQ